MPAQSRRGWNGRDGPPGLTCPTEMVTPPLTQSRLVRDRQVPAADNTVKQGWEQWRDTCSLCPTYMVVGKQVTPECGRRFARRRVGLKRGNRFFPSHTQDGDQVPVK